MNKKGFSLVELLAVIIILSTIFVIAMVIYNGAVDNRKENDYKNIVNMIEENTKVLVTTDFDISSKVDDKLENNVQCKIEYSLLIQKGLMDADTKNPITNEIINPNSYIMITLNANDELEYEFVDLGSEESDNTLANCLTADSEEPPQDNSQE